MEDKSQANQVQTANMNRSKAPQKVEVVRATLKGKYPTHLVTDYETATALL